MGSPPVLGALALGACESVASETLDARRVLRMPTEEEGRLLITDRGRDGVLRPFDVGVGVSMLLCPGEE